MPTRRLMALLALLVGAGAATASPITPPLFGESFLLAYTNSSSPGGAVYELRSDMNYGSVTSSGVMDFPVGSSSVLHADPNGRFSAFAGVGHTVTNNSVTITGATSAFSANTIPFVGAQAAGDSQNAVGGPTFFGYYIQFELDQTSDVEFSLKGEAGTSGNGELLYADFGAYLLDSSADFLNPLGVFGVIIENGQESDDSLGTGSLSLFGLDPGTYYLFVQSQSSITNGSGLASADFEASVVVTPSAEIPEPISLVVFGGLLAAGGAAVVRRRKMAV